jgi:lipopolysaccharide biosynthesis glycosyltransferase
MTEHAPIVVACAADDRYAAPLAVMVRSLLDNLGPGRRAILHVLDGGIAPENRRKAMASWDLARAEVRWLPGPFSRVARLKPWESFGPTTFFRIVLADVLARDFRRAIYLDSDLLVLGDLGEIWDADLCGRPLGAVEDVFRRMAEGLPSWRELGLDPEARYFNAGVMLVDLERWREERIGAAVLEAVERHAPLFRWHDQDALNATLAGRWLDLDPHWNVGIESFWPRTWMGSTYSREAYESLVARPKIVHFCGVPKPWSPGSDHPRRDLYFRYLDRTDWSGWRPPPEVRVRPPPPPSTAG